MVFVRTRPEDPPLTFDLFVGDAGIIGDVAFRRHAQFIEDFAWLIEGEAALAAHRAGYVLNNAPILFRVARRINRFVDLDDAPFDLCDDAFVLFVQRAGQDDVGVVRRFIQEEVYRHVKFQFVEHTRDEVVVRQRDLRVEADRKQAFDLAAINFAEDFVGVHARAGHLFFVNAPDFRYVSAVLWIVNVAGAGQLITLLTMLAPALPVALTCNRRVTAALAPDAARSQHDVDRAEHILHAVRVMLDATRVQQERRFRIAPHLGGPPDR